MKRLFLHWSSIVLPLFAAVVLSVVACPSQAQASQAPDAFQGRVVVHGARHPLARPEFAIRHTDPSTKFEHMILALKRSPAKQQQLDRFLAAQLDRTSPDFHRWLTPAEFGHRFGPSDADIQRVTAWLQSSGFTVDRVARGRGWVNFTGTTAQVEAAFQTTINDYFVNGQVEHANATEPSFPAALADVVAGPVSLNSFRKHHIGHQDLRKSLIQPADTISPGSFYELAPGDFAKIYDISSVYSSYTGSGIAILARSNVNVSDATTFRSHFGLPTNNPFVIVNGADPGIVCPSGVTGAGCDEAETVLDMEWAGATAPGASVQVDVSKSTSSTDGIDLSAQYVVDYTTAYTISLSYGECESSLGSGGNAFWSSLWSQAAAQGQTVLVSSGDNGAAGCDPASGTSSSGRAVNGLASTPYNVAVGGTEFNDSGSYSTYWASTNNADYSSALGYIPEVAWNDSGSSGLWSSGGGASNVYGKPSWQSAPGVPADGARDVPDVAFSASGAHDPYQIYISPYWYTIGGTSASTPSFAGIVSLLEEKEGAPIGNIAPYLYSFGAAQYGSSGTAVFNDITSGNNSVPGTTGFSAGTGYDQVTGLGSVKAATLLSVFPTATTYLGTTDMCSQFPPKGSTVSNPSGAINNDTTMLMSTRPTFGPVLAAQCTWGGFSSVTPSGNTTLYVYVSPNSNDSTNSAYVTIYAGGTLLYQSNNLADNTYYTYDQMIAVPIPAGTDLSTITISASADAGGVAGDSASLWVSDIEIVTI